MWNDITVDVINVECDPEESNQGGIEPGPSLFITSTVTCVAEAFLGVK